MVRGLSRVLLLVIAVAAVGCGSTAPEWQKATSATGRYVAEFPGKPTVETQPAPSTGLELQITALESGDQYFGLVETALRGVQPYSLDVAVDGALESARAGQEPHWGTATATELSRTTGEFDGVETRTFRAELAGGGETVGVDGRLFYRDDAIVQAIVISQGERDPDAVTRFLSSVRPAEAESGQKDAA